MNNPFQCTSPVIGNDFYGREKILSGILNNNQLNHVWVIGARRSGKTSLLKQLQFIVNNSDFYLKNYIPVFWDMQGIFDITGLKERLINGLWENCDIFNKFGISLDEFENERYDLESILGKISRFIIKSKNPQVLFLCDEVEALVNISKKSAHILSILRYHFQNNWNKTVIISTGALWNLKESGQKESVFLSGFAPPTYALGPLSPKDSLSLIRKINYSDYQLPPIWEDRICQFTNRVPFYIQLVCMNIWDKKPKSIEETKELTINSMDFNLVLENDLKGLNYVEMLILLQIIERPGININDINKHILNETNIDDIQDFINNLKLLSYIQEKEDHSFYVDNHFLNLWYQKNLKKLIEKHRPASLTILFGQLGDISALKGDLYQARNLHKKLLNTEPNHRNYQRLGETYLRLGNYDKAIDILKKALELSPDDAQTLMLTGLSYDFMGNKEKYKEYCIKSFKLNPDVAFKNIESLRKQLLSKEKEQTEAINKNQKKMLSFLTHTLRNTLAGGPETVEQVLRLTKKIAQENYQEKRTYKIFNNIASLNTTFSFISNMLDTYKLYIADKEQLQLKWQNDKNGNEKFSYLFALVLKQTIGRIQFDEQHQTQFKKIVNKQQKYSLKDIRESFLINILPLELTAENTIQVFDWIKKYFSVITTEIDFSLNINSKGVRFHFLFASISEIVYNALKYTDLFRPIQIKWFVEKNDYVFTCQNSYKQEDQIRTGSKKGLDFIKAMLDIIDGITIHIEHGETLYTVKIYIEKNLLK